MSLLRWTLVLVAGALIAWLLTHRPLTSGMAPLADPPWGPGKNVFDCEKDATVNPLPPELDAAQRSRVMALLREACRGDGR